MKQYSLDKSKIKVLLLEGIHGNAVQHFRDNGYTDIEIHKEALSEKELIEKETSKASLKTIIYSEKEDGKA